MRHTILRTVVILLLASGGHAAMAQAGTDFWFGFMKNYYDASSLLVRISAEVSTSGMISLPLQGWSQAFTVTPGSTTSIEVPLSAEAQAGDSIGDQGIRVQTMDPVTVSAYNLESGTADASAIIPVPSLGNNYIGQAYRGLQGFDLYSELLIIATADSTLVTITPSATTITGHPAGVPFTVPLNTGQSYFAEGQNYDDDLTGTFINAVRSGGGCARIAVFGGSECADVPTGCYACDHLYEQCVPTNEWGTQYHAFPFGVSTTYALRAMAREPNTTVTFSNGTTTVLDAGHFVEINQLQSDLCIEGDKPIAVSEYMEGQSCGAANADPSLMNLRAVEHQTLSVTVNAPSAAEDPSRTVAILTTPGNIGALMMDGSPIPVGGFRAYTACGDLVLATVPLPSGSHVINAPNGFQAYQYAGGPNYESYAFALASSMAPIAQLDSVICYTGGPITLNAPGDVVQPYWFAQSAPSDTLGFGASLTITPMNDDVFIVADLADTGACTTGGHSFPAEFVQPLTLSLSQDTGNTCAHAPVHLIASLAPPSSDCSYQWTHPELLNASISSAPLAHLNDDTWFTVAVTSPHGCNTATDSMLVNVQPSALSSVEASISSEMICAGGTVQLIAHAQQAFQQMIGDAFDDSLSGLWSTVSNGDLDDSCGSVSGNALRFNGPAPRYAQTVPLDLTGGGVVSFYVKIGNGVAPCDDAEPGDDVRFEASTDMGATWGLAMLILENSCPAFTFRTWNITPGTMTTHTMLRWRQTGTYGTGEDNWALDNISTGQTANNTLYFAWSPAMLVYDPDSAATSSAPTSSTTYTVIVTDQLTGCHWSDNVSVFVGDPITVSALSNDTSLCGNITNLQLVAQCSDPGSALTWSSTGGSFSDPHNDTTLFSTTLPSICYVSADNFAGCLATDSVQVTVLDVPLIPTIYQADTFLWAYPAYNVQWYLDGSAILGATSQEYVPSQPGTYTVVITLTDGCSAISEPFVINGLGITTHDLPLPTTVYDDASRSILITSTAPMNEVLVYSADGQLLRDERSIHSDHALIPITPAFGIYHVRVIRDDGVFTTKLLIATR